MPKQKPKSPNTPAPPPYRDEDIAAFVADLETEGPGDDAGTSPTTTTRRVQVQAQPDESAHSQTAILTPAAITLDHIVPGQPPQEMRQLTRAKRSRFPWAWTISILALLVIVSVAGLLIFNRAKRFTGNNVQVHFTPVVSAVSGSPLKVVVEYQNLEPVDLTQAELTIEYPDGFTYTSSQPEATKDYHNAFALGTIRSGQSGRVSVVGILIGAVGESREFSATLTYRPSTFNSEFQQKASTQINIATSILGLKFTGPTQLAPGASATWTVTYANTADHDLDNVQVEAVYPDGLTVTTTVPAATERSAVWNLGVVKKGATGTITITGTVNGNLGDTFPLNVKVGLVSATNTVDLQDEQSLLIILVKTGVTTTIAVNGSTDPVVIDAGESLNYTIRVTNASEVEVTNATVTATLAGSALDLSTFVSDSAGSLKDQVVTWTKDSVAALTNLKPNQAVSLTFAVGTKANLAVKVDGDRDPAITATVDVQAPGLVTTTNQGRNPATVSVTKIATILKLTAEARYYDEQGIALGTGPVPPRVGSTTSYRIAWTITNTTSDAATLVVSARLPNSVLWTGQHLARDAGDLAFAPDSRTVRWTLNTVPAGTGARLPSLTATFDVSITPTVDQVNTIPVLLETSTASATDSFTKRELSSTASTLSADVPTDAQAGGEGRVVAGP